jgi:Flp pilus assembly protein TadG
MMMTAMRRWKSENGQSLVEAALALPLLCLILIGIVEFAQILIIKQALTNAAREGARVGALELDNSQALSTAQATAEDYLNKSGVDLSRSSVQSSFSTINGIDAVEIDISYQYQSSLTAWIPGVPSTLGLASRVVMRREA